MSATTEYLYVMGGVRSVFAVIVALNAVRLEDCDKSTTKYGVYYTIPQTISICHCFYFISSLISIWERFYSYGVPSFIIQSRLLSSGFIRHR